MKIPRKDVKKLLNELHAYIEMRPMCESLLRTISVEAEIREHFEKLGELLYVESVKLLEAKKLSPCPLCGGAFRSALHRRRP